MYMLAGKFQVGFRNVEFSIGFFGIMQNLEEFFFAGRIHF
jgi:hypothetical protein